MLSGNSSLCRLGGVSATLPHLKRNRVINVKLLSSYPLEDQLQSSSALEFKCDCSVFFLCTPLLCLLGLVFAGQCYSLMLMSLSY